MSMQIKVPDIGDFDAVDVIEVLISEGDEIQAEQSVLVLESDKASMEVPAESAGKVLKVLVKVGDKVKEGDVIAEVEATASVDKPAQTAEPAQASESPAQKGGSDGNTEVQPLTVPDIGDFDAVDVIEVNVKAGDHVDAEQGIITLESDKASMEVPSPGAGEILSISVKVGDKVSTGDVIGEIRVGGGQSQAASAQPEEKPKAEKAAPAAQPDKPAAQKPVAPQASQNIDETAFSNAHASPSVRRFARELGADLGKVRGSGRKGRILEEDVKAFIKQALSGSGSQTAGGVAQGQGSGIPPIPAVDFSKFGDIEEQKLSRINILTGEAMTRCWLNIPHVTQHDLADITDLEAFRKALKPEAEKRGVRVTMLAFLMKALAKALQELPRFNSSLSADKKSLILKKYIHIGIAVDTPNGLVVPVIRDVDKKGIYELSEDLMAMSKKAREGKLSPSDMQGASMTISSLGGIGGTYFTPIVNAPEVAILGVSRSTMQPVWNGKEFVPRLMLPLSLSYDHRVIDGALAARMTVLLGELLADMKRSLL